MKLNDTKRETIRDLYATFGGLVTRKQVLEFIKSRGGTIADVRFVFNKRLRVNRASYNIAPLYSDEPEL